MADRNESCEPQPSSLLPALQRMGNAGESWDESILSQWHQAKEEPVGVNDKGEPTYLFRSTVEDNRVRRVDGKLGLIATVNVKRTREKRKTKLYEAKPLHKGSPPSTAASAPSLLRPFDPNDFNFNKANPKETIGELCVDGEKHPVLLNVSPIFEGHILVVPWSQKCLPQYLTREALTVALEFSMASSRDDFKVMFNSSGAWASVNHLHFHGMYVSGVCPSGLPIETAPTASLIATLPLSLPPAPSVTVSASVLQYPSSPIVFTVDGEAVSRDVRDGLVDVVWGLVELLVAEDCPFNLTMSLRRDGRGRIYFIPRRPQVISTVPPFRSPDGDDDPDGPGILRMAVCECSGVPILYSEEAFEQLTEAHFRQMAEEDISIEAALREKLCEGLVRLMGTRGADKGG